MSHKRRTSVVCSSPGLSRGVGLIPYKGAGNPNLQRDGGVDKRVCEAQMSRVAASETVNSPKMMQFFEAEKTLWMNMNEQYV